MDGFVNLMAYGLKRRIKDFFIIVYSVVFPLLLIVLLGYLTTNFFKGDNRVTSNDYYTLVMLPFYLLTSTITVAYVAKDESLRKTAYRFIIAPIDKGAIVLSKILSCTIVIWLCAIFNLTVTRFLLGVKLGQSTFIILLMFLAETFASAAFGIFLGICINSFSAIKGILNIPLNIFALLGGVFFPVGSLGVTFDRMSYVSPCKWINRGLMAAVYDNNFNILIYTIVVCTAIGILFSVLSVISFKKEAFL